MSHQEKQEIFDRISIEKWKLNFKDFLSGTINEVHGEVLSTQDAIIQIEEVVFDACDLVQEEQQKRIAEKALVKFDYIGLNKTGATMSQKYFAGPGMRQYTADKDSIINPENKIS